MTPKPLLIHGQPLFARWCIARLCDLGRLAVQARGSENGVPKSARDCSGAMASHVAVLAAAAVHSLAAPRYRHAARAGQHRTGKLSNQALLQTLQENITGQINSDEHHLALARLTGAPGGPEVAAHELMHPLKNHLGLGALHIQDTLVTQHPGAVDVDDCAQKVLQLGRLEGPLRPEHKALHIVIMAVMVAVRRMVTVLAVIMVMRFCKVWEEGKRVWGA